MTPQTTSPLSMFEPILLLVFTLMLFAGLAGGNAGMVLKPVFEICAQLLSALLSILCVAVSALLRLVLSITTSGVQKLLNDLQQHSKRNSNR